MMEFVRGTVTPRDWMAAGGMLGALLLAIGAFTFFIRSAQSDRLVQIKAEDALVIQDIERARQIEANIQTLREETQKIEELVRLVEERLPLEREIPRFGEQFEALADQAGVRVELKPLPTTEDQRKATIPYEITAWGNFHEITNFVNRLERFERYLKISNLNIGREENGVSKATFTLSTYRFIQSKPAAPQPAAPTAAGTAP